MNVLDFANMKERFRMADTEEKINLYTTAENLTTEQYKELLHLFPLQELHRLEEAMQAM